MMYVVIVVVVVVNLPSCFSLSRFLLSLLTSSKPFELSSELLAECSSVSDCILRGGGGVFPCRAAGCFLPIVSVFLISGPFQLPALLSFSDKKSKAAEAITRTTRNLPYWGFKVRNLVLLRARYGYTGALS